MLIAGPNLTIDRTLAIDEIRPGEVLRFTSAEITPGGKGVNVARTARALSARARLVGFVAGHTGEAVKRMIADERIDFVPVAIRGEMRSTAIILESGGRATVFNEPGPEIADGDWRRYERAVEENIVGHKIVICIGSAPPGSPEDAYARLVRICKRNSVLCLVDASGEWLLAALEAGPEFVCPSLAEAEGVLMGGSEQLIESDGADVERRALHAAEGLVGMGAHAAIVTADKAGLAFSIDGVAGWIDAPKVEVGNPIGAGDALVGGFAAALEMGEPYQPALTIAVSVAAASVETMRAGAVDAARARALAEGLR